MRRTLRKSEILRGRAVFGRVFKDGKRYRSDHLRCLVLPGTGDGVKFAVAVSSSSGKAHARNRIKRQIREAYRTNKSVMTAQSKTVVFVWDARRKLPAAGMDYKVLEREVVGLLTQISGS